MKLSKRQYDRILCYIKNKHTSNKPLHITYKSIFNYYLNFYKHRRFIVHNFSLKHHNKRTILVHNKFKIRGGFGLKCVEMPRFFYGIPIIIVKNKKKKKRNKIKKKKKEKKKKKKKKKLYANSTIEPTEIIVLSDTDTDTETYEILGGKACLINEHDDVTKNPTKCDKQRGEYLKKSINNTEPNKTADSSDESDFNDNSVLSKKQLTNEHEFSPLQWTEKSSNENSFVNGTFDDSDADNQEIDSNDVPSVTQEDVNEQLRRQLKLLKMGKSEVSLLGSRDKDRSSSSSRRSTLSALSVPSRRSTIDDRAALRKSSTSLNDSQTIENIEMPSSESETRTENEQSSQANPKNRSGIIDSLYNKLQRLEKESVSETINTRSSKTIAETKQILQRSKKVASQNAEQNKSTTLSLSSPSPSSSASSATKNSGKLELNNNEDSNHSTCSSSNADFLGFDATFKTGLLTGLLPTPHVPRSSNKQAVFVSEELDIFMKENALDNVANITVPVVKKKIHDEALITIDALPPTLSIPERPLHMQRPRTLAQKRQMLQKQKDLKYIMFENESTIYHELKKRKKMGPSYDNSRLRDLQNVDVPFTRDCWRAACWLNTENNKFYYQTIKFDGNDVKLLSGRGNNETKMLYEIQAVEQKPEISKFNSIKRTQSLENVKINNFWINCNQNKIKTDDKSIETESKLNTEFRKLNTIQKDYITPGPMCKKTTIRSSFDIEFGPLQTLQLPIVQLEVWPAIDRPLPDHIRPYLKQVIPDGTVITEQWANFAVSVIKTKKVPQQKHRRKYKKQTLEEPKSFVFDIPYENKQRKILVRRRRIFTFKGDCPQYTPAFLSKTIDKKYRFARNVDPIDNLGVECSFVLGGIMDAVVVSLHGDGLTKPDPDIDYVGKIVPAKNENNVIRKQKLDKPEPIGQRRKSTYGLSAARSEDVTKFKMLKELRRLNATIISTSELKEKEACNKSFCQMGCVCESISTEHFTSDHCQEVQCIFGCTCEKDKINLKKSTSSRGNFNQLREQAISRLAKEEKEFTSTFVFSDNDMFLLPNAEKLGKRNKKPPKRFSEWQLEESAKEDTMDNTEFVPKRMRRSERNFIPASSAIHDAKDKVTTARVSLKKLKGLENYEPWCMFHCLYKCYCKGRAIKGKPFVLRNDENDRPVFKTTYAGIDNNTRCDNIVPRKRQYTFDRESDNNTNNSLSAQKKIQKLNVTPGTQESEYIDITSAARVRVYKSRHPKKQRSDLISLRKKFFAEEKDYEDLLSKRILTCRTVFMDPTKMKDSARKALLKTLPSSTPIYDLTANDEYEVERNPLEVTNHVDESLTNKTNNDSSDLRKKTTCPNVQTDELDRILTDTMRHFRNIQRTGAFDLSSEAAMTPHKITIVRWQRMVTAFKNGEVFIWEIRLENSDTILALTTQNEMPTIKRASFIENIKVIDYDSLPMLGKMLMDSVENDKTEHLAILLFRVTTFWRIIGAVHSEQEYLKNHVRIKSMPKNNPELTDKISTLYNLLTAKQKMKSMVQNQTKPPGSSVKANSVSVNVGSADDDFAVLTPIPNAVNANTTNTPNSINVLNSEYNINTVNVSNSGHNLNSTSTINMRYVNVNPVNIINPAHKTNSKNFINLGHKFSHGNVVNSGQNIVPVDVRNTGLNTKHINVMNSGKKMIRHVNDTNAGNNIIKSQVKPKGHKEQLQHLTEVPMDDDSFTDSYVIVNERIQEDGVTRKEANKTNSIQKTCNSFRSNIEMKSCPEAMANKLLLHIPCTGNQRWLMLTVENDFTHIWFQDWRKFLSKKRITSSLEDAKVTNKVFDISRPHVHPQVYVTPQYSNEIFIGPYECDSKNIALFQRHENRMMLVENYMKHTGIIYEKRTKGCWLISKDNKKSNDEVIAVQPQTDQLKIQNIYSLRDLPNENVSLPVEEIPSTSSSPEVSSAISTVFPVSILKTTVSSSPAKTMIQLNGNAQKPTTGTYTTESLNSALPTPSAVKANVFTSITNTETFVPSTTSSVIVQKSSPLKIKLVSSGVYMPDFSSAKSTNSTKTTTIPNIGKNVILTKNANMGLPVITSVRSGFFPIGKHFITGLSAPSSVTPSKVITTYPKLLTLTKQSTPPTILQHKELTTGNASTSQAKISLVNNKPKGVVLIDQDKFITVAKQGTPTATPPFEMIKATNLPRPQLKFTLFNKNLIQPTAVDQHKLVTISQPAVITPTNTQRSQVKIVINKPKEPVLIDQNKSATINSLEPIEIIDLSDEEDNNDQNDSEETITINSTDVVSTIPKNIALKEVGYLYSENAGMGKIQVERTNDSIQFRLPCLKFKCFLSNIADWRDLSSVENFLATYMQKIAYYVYPLDLKLKWNFARQYIEHKHIPEHQIETLNDNKVVFRFRIVDINSNYRENPNLTDEEKYAMEVLHLAKRSKIPDIKGAPIKDILKKAEEVATKLNVTKIYLESAKLKYNKLLKGRVQNKNR